MTTKSRIFQYLLERLRGFLQVKVLVLLLFHAQFAEVVMLIGVETMSFENLGRTLQWTAVERDDRPAALCHTNQRFYPTADAGDA